MTPEPCLAGRCWSPLACTGWQYCRKRNREVHGAPSHADQEYFRGLAADRKVRADDKR
jgi:hypothetical protein